MIKSIIIIIFIIINTNSWAQKWVVRVSVNAIKSDCGVNVTSINDPKGNTYISNDQLSPVRVLGKRFNSPKLGSFADFSVIRHIDNKRAIMVGGALMTYYIYSSITNLYGTFGHASTIAMPAIKINYMYTVLQSKKANPAEVTLSAGILLNFKNWTGSSGKFNGSAVTALDSSGNVQWQYTKIEYVGAKEPRPPFPYINIGIDGYVPLCKRFKLGLNFTSYAGTKSLFIQHIKGETNDAQFTYDIKLKPYFFSGGLFLQYRIK